MNGRLAARVTLAFILVAGALVALPSGANAVFHLIQIREIFPGSLDNPNAQFIELQMYTGNQNFVIGHDVAVFDAAGEEIASFTFTNNVPNGANQATILIATTEAELAFQTQADLVMTPVIPRAGGKVCWADNVDCASWGNYTGDAEGTGTPFAQGTGLIPGQSMERKIAGGSGPGLDEGDDTDDSATDFQNASPSPTPNTSTGGSPSPSPSGSESPAPQPHERSVTLKHSGEDRLTLSGRVKVEDGFAACGSNVPVRAQKRAGSAWDTVKRGSTNDGGRYSLTVADRPGRYRTLAPAVSREGERCRRAASRARRNR